MVDADGKDAEHLLDFVNDAAAAVNAHFVTFLTVGVYIAVTIASTTDEMLVRGSLVTLPLLNVQIPISGVFGFYMAAPVLIFGMHVYLLLLLSALARKLSYFEAALADLGDTQRNRLRDRVVSYQFVQFLSSGARDRISGLVPALVFFGCMIAFPLGLLGWTLFRFLPLRDLEVTSVHRVVLFADVAVVWLFLSRPMVERDARLRANAPSRGWAPLIALAAVGLAGCAAVVFLAVIAGRECRFCYQPSLDLTNKVLTAKELTPETINALKDGDVEKRQSELAKVLQLSVLQGRDLRGAKFKGAVLPKIDLRTLTLQNGKLVPTRLCGADLTWTQMQEVLLDDADVRGAKLQGAQLQGASMRRVAMQNADLDGAQLQEAKLSGAHLEGAQLPSAQLQGAILEDALFFAANLKGAQLQGANLRGAQLQGADLTDADLSGADLSGANLDGAVLRRAKLGGSLLCGTAIGEADFDGAILDLVDICAAAEFPFGGNDELTPPVCQCSTALANEYYSCRPQCDEARYRDALQGQLTRLACKDPYVARGLSARALREPRKQSTGLAAILVKLVGAEDCPGVELLPDGTVESLRELSGGAIAKKSAPDS